MVQVNIREAKTQFSRLLKLAEAGEEVVIARNGVPVARLVAVPRKAGKPVFGSMKGIIEFDESFFDPLPAEFMAHFRDSVERNHKLYELLDD